MPAGKTSRPKRQHAWNVMLLAFFFAVTFFLRMASIGLPQGWINTLSEKISTPNLAFEMERVSISFRRRELDVGRIQVYLRGHVSEAMFELLDTSVRLWPKRGEHPLSWVRAIRVRRAVVPRSVSHLPYMDSPTSPASANAPENLKSFASRATVGELPDWGPLQFTCKELSFLGTTAGSLAATIKNQDSLLILDPVSVGFSSEENEKETLKGRLVFAFTPFMFTVEIAGKLDAPRIAPIFKAFDLPETASEIARFTFPQEAAEVNLNLDYDPTNQQREITIQINSGYCLYNDVTLNKANATVSISGSNCWRHVRINPLSIERPEGQANGFIDIDTKQSLLGFSLESTIDPLHLLRIIRITSKPISLPLGFDNPTRIVASGQYDLKRHPTRSHITGTLSAPRVTSYGIDFLDSTFDAVITDPEWRIAHGTATVYGGRFEGGAIFTPSPTNTADVVMKSNGSFQGLQHAGWSSLLGDTSETSDGTLDLDYSLTGPILDDGDAFVNALSGSARIALDDVQLYRIPLFAGLTKILAENIPGVDFVLSQDALNASLLLTNGIVTLPAVKVIGNFFSASGAGTIDVDGNVDLKMKVHLLNRETWVGQSLYYVLFPLSKIFELQATGTIERPKWSSATLSTRKKSEK